MIDTKSDPGAWQREIDQRPKGISEYKVIEWPEGPHEVAVEQRADDLEAAQLGAAPPDEEGRP